jgi:quercetin dioxygenase-like cupin family protein
VGRVAVVLRPDELPVRERGGGIRTIPLVTRDLGAAGFISGYTIFPPHGVVPLHTHNCDESVVVMQGRGIAHIDGVDHPVLAGDVTFIPRGLPHGFRNVSDADEMKILWTYASTAATRTLVATGETRRIDDEHDAALDAAGSSSTSGVADPA